MNHKNYTITTNRSNLANTVLKNSYNRIFDGIINAICSLAIVLFACIGCKQNPTLAGIVDENAPMSENLDFDIIDLHNADKLLHVKSFNFEKYVKKSSGLSGHKENKILSKFFENYTIKCTIDGKEYFAGQIGLRRIKLLFEHNLNLAIKALNNPSIEFELASNYRKSNEINKPAYYFVSIDGTTLVDILLDKWKSNSPININGAKDKLCEILKLIKADLELYKPCLDTDQLVVYIKKSILCDWHEATIFFTETFINLTTQPQLNPLLIKVISELACMVATVDSHKEQILRETMEKLANKLKDNEDYSIILDTLAMSKLLGPDKKFPKEWKQFVNTLLGKMPSNLADAEKKNYMTC